MWTFASLAFAVPNDLCVGTCADGAACGGPADCGGDACTFPDACLPGLSGLIEAVEPELPNALNTYDSGWVCGYLTCVPSADELSFSSSYGIYTYATKDLTLAPGRTYLLRGLLGADAGAHGYLDVVSYDLDADSPFVWDAPVPVPVTIWFEVPPTHVGPVALHLHADGAGSLHLSDLVIYELADYGVWLRFAAPGALGPVRFADGWVLRHGITAGDPHGYYPRACTGPVEPTCIDPSLTETIAEPGAFSPWIEVSAMFDGGWRASHAWNLTNAMTGAPLSDVTVQVQMAFAPDPAAVLWDDTRLVTGDTVGIVLPDGVPHPLDLLTHRGYVADSALADLPVLEADPAWAPARQPALYWTGSVLGSIDRFAQPDAVDGTLELFQAIGFNRRSFMTDDPSASLRAHAEKLGLTKDLLHGEYILAPWNYTSTDLDLLALRATADANLSAAGFAAVAADYPSRPEDLFVLMGDEIGGLLLDGPLYAEGFREYLSAQGLTEADFGVADLADLSPLPNLVWWRVAELRPNPLANVSGAKLFYWQLRWWNEATARGYRVARDAVEQQPEWGAPYPMSFNAGTPFAPQYFTYNLGTEFQTMADAGAVTALHAEAFLLFNDMCRAQQLSWFADFTSAQARPWGFDQHAYLHAQRGDQVTKVLALAARGYRYFDSYMYGPYDLSTGDGAGGLGDLSASWLGRVTASSDALARAESWLFDAERDPSAVAILSAQSDPVWTGLGASTQNEAGWHLAWTHNHQPVDFIVEEQLVNELDLRSVLLVDRAHLSAAAWDEVQAWVEGGGTLILGRGLAGRDEYGQPVEARATWLGVTTGNVNDGRAEPERVLWGDDFEVSTEWVVLAGGTPLATYRDGQAAVVEVVKGNGRVVVVGFALGEQYLEAITDLCPSIIPAEVSSFPEAYVDAVREAAGSLVDDLPLNVDVDDPLVEVVRLRRPGGGAIVVTAYRNAPVTVTISAPDLPATVTEALSGASLPVVDGAVTVELDHAAVLGWVDEPMATEPTTEDPPVGTTSSPTDPPNAPPAADPRPACGCAAPGGGGSMAGGLLFVILAGLWRLESGPIGRAPRARR